MGASTENFSGSCSNASGRSDGGVLAAIPSSKSTKGRNDVGGIAAIPSSRAMKKETSIMGPVLAALGVGSIAHENADSPKDAFEMNDIGNGDGSCAKGFSRSSPLVLSAVGGSVGDDYKSLMRGMRTNSLKRRMRMS